MKNVQAYLGKWVTVVCRDGSEVWGLVEFSPPPGTTRRQRTAFCSAGAGILT